MNAGRFVAKKDKKAILNGQHLRCERDFETDNETNVTQMTLEEYIGLINTSLNGLSENLLGDFLEDEYFLEIIKKTRDAEYKKLNNDEKLKFWANVNACFASAYEGIVANSVYGCEGPANGEHVFMDNTGLYINNEILKYTSGIAMLQLYSYALMKNILISVLESAYTNAVMSDDLDGIAKIYHQNYAISFLEGNWKNFLDKNDANYACQPIIFDCIKLSKDVGYGLVRKLYDEYGVIDSAMSDAIYEHMRYIANYPEMMKSRKELIEQAEKNLDNIEQEYELAEEYLSVCEGDLTKLSDDEFYGLFNTAYSEPLNSNENGNLDKRILNLVNELFNRTFKGFDLTDIEIPEYDIKVDDSITAIKRYGGEMHATKVDCVEQVFALAFQDFGKFAQKNALFVFNDDQEEKDFATMAKWCIAKKGEKATEKDKEILNNGLNIILRKISDLYSGVQKKCTEAIANSKFLPHGNSMLSYDDKSAYYDYHEFKNGKTREEVNQEIMNYIKVDLKDIEGRKA